MLNALPREVLSGWGNYQPVECAVLCPANQGGLDSAVGVGVGVGGSVTARGLGRSYGDPAVSDTGVVVDCSGSLRHILAFVNAPTEPGFVDSEPTRVTAEAGVSLADLVEVSLVRGCFLPVTPGTKFVTLGGAIAADVHGKNHHAVGSIATFVESFELLIADGSTIVCSRVENERVFHATLGGMGLTGVIRRATLRMLRVPSAYIRVRHERASSLVDAIDALERTESETTYSVAWIDCLARGARMGRSVLMLGEHANRSELSLEQAKQPYAVPLKRVKSVPSIVPGFALNPLTVRAFNEVYYRTHPDKTAITDYDSFFYPLDSIQHWNRIYGKRGFIQFQALLPKHTAREGLHELLTRLAKSGMGSFLAVLKTCGPASEGPLSYLYPGFTLALDLPNTGSRLLGLMEECNRLLLDYEGRIYAAKDAVTDAATFARMYPRLDEFRSVKRAVDPDTRFDSALARRLGITG